jgi:hypothetical protein
MRPAAIALVILTAALCPAHGQTYVPATDITTNTTWSVAGSPYIIQGLVDVSDGAILTIDPGVTVKFDGFYQIRAMDGGSVYAPGTQGQGITFTSNSGTPAADDWIWLFISDSPASYFSYCTVEYCRKGFSLIRSSPTITNCTIRHTNWEGLTCEDGSPTIQDCEIHDTSAAISLYANAGTPQPVIHGCNLYDSITYNLILGGYDDAPLVTIDAESNWWGTNIESEIEDTIDHDVDHPGTYGHVDFDPWLMDTPVEEVTWARVKAMFSD